MKNKNKNWAFKNVPADFFNRIPGYTQNLVNSIVKELYEETPDNFTHAPDILEIEGKYYIYEYMSLRNQNFKKVHNLRS